MLCSCNIERKNDLKKIYVIDSIQEVIFPLQFKLESKFARFSRWSPKYTDIVEGRTILEKCRIDHNKELDKDDDFISKLDSLHKYAKQYFGLLNESDEKILFVNCSCDTNIDSWTLSYVKIMDGGACNFTVMINLDKKTCYNLFVNNL